MNAEMGARGPTILHVAAVEYTATALLAPQMRWLLACGYDVRLACSPDGSSFQVSLAEFQPVELAFPRSGNPRAMLRACRRFVEIVNEMRPAIVHLHTPAAAIPTRMIFRSLIPRQTRIVYTAHGFAHVWDGGGLRMPFSSESNGYLRGEPIFCSFSRARTSSRQDGAATAQAFATWVTESRTGGSGSPRERPLAIPWSCCSWGASFARRG